jgi:hypothetical protein
VASDPELARNWRQVVADAADPGVRDRALLVFNYALATAPIDTGEYKAKIRMYRLSGGGYRIVAEAPHSIFVEYGTRYMAAYHTLAVALDAAKG